MAGFRDPGPTCVTTAPASDAGTQCRGRTPVPGTLRCDTKGTDLHKGTDLPVSKTTSSAAQPVSSGGRRRRRRIFHCCEHGEQNVVGPHSGAQA